MISQKSKENDFHYFLVIFVLYFLSKQKQKNVLKQYIQIIRLFDPLTRKIQKGWPLKKWQGTYFLPQIVIHSLTVHKSYTVQESVNSIFFFYQYLCLCFVCWRW